MTGTDPGTDPAPKELRVAVAWPHAGAGTETFIRAHVERLDARVTVVQGDPLPLLVAGGPSLLPRPHRLALRALGRLVPTATEPLTKYSARLYPRGIRSRFLARFLQQEAIDVVLAEYGTTGVGVMDACRLAGRPLVVHFHGWDAYARAVFRGMGRRYGELFDRASAIVAVSRDMKRQLISLGAPERKVVYHPYGVDTYLFRGGDPAASPPRFVAVGRFVAKKAPVATIQAFAAVAREVPDASLIMIGDGPLLPDVRRVAAVLGVADRIELRGARPHSEVQATLQGARAFVQHSVEAPDGDHEGTPLAVLEASATGLPVIATAHGGITDVVEDGRSGLLVAEGDVDGMGEAMLELARDPARAARLGRRAREIVTDRFSMDRSIRGLRQILAEAAEANR